jgi:hypothetical protein
VFAIHYAHIHTHNNLLYVLPQDDAMSVVEGSPKHSPSTSTHTSPGGTASTGSRRSRGPPITVVNGSSNSLLNHDGTSNSNSSSVPGRRGSYSGSGSTSAATNPLMHPDYSIKICLTVSIHI